VSEFNSFGLTQWYDHELMITVVDWYITPSDMDRHDTVTTA